MVVPAGGLPQGLPEWDCQSGTGTLVYHVANALLWFGTIQMYPLIYYTATAEFGSMVQNLTM